MELCQCFTLRIRHISTMQIPSWNYSGSLFVCSKLELLLSYSYELRGYLPNAKHMGEESPRRECNLEINGMMIYLLPIF